MTNADYIRTDEREDAVDALEHVSAIVATLPGRPLRWKWVILALHNALQGALVCTLSGTSGLGALGSSSQKKVLRWLEEASHSGNREMPEMWLADVMDLYKRTKDSKLMAECGGDPLAENKDRDSDVERLHQLRNVFAHFSPKGWSIEIAGLPRIAISAVQIIEELLLSHPANTFRFDEVQASRVRKSIDGIRSSLAEYGTAS